MFSVLLIVLIIYYMYQSISGLIAYTDPWGWLQFIVLALNILFVPILVFMVIRAIREQKQKTADREEQERKEREEKRKMFDEEYDLIDARTSDLAQDDDAEDIDDSNDVDATPTDAEKALADEKKKPDAAELEKIAPDVKAKKKTTKSKKKDVEPDTDAAEQ